MSVIVWPNSDFDLTRRNREQLILELQKKLVGRVAAVYIFGSYATQTHNSESDIDLVIIHQTDVLFTQRPIEFSDILDVYPAIDILVYTPDEFERMRNSEDDFFKGATLLKIL